MFWKLLHSPYKIAEIRNAEKIIGTFYEEELSLLKPTDVNQI